MSRIDVKHQGRINARARLMLLDNIERHLYKIGVPTTVHKRMIVLASELLTQGLLNHHQQPALDDKLFAKSFFAVGKDEQHFFVLAERAHLVPRNKTIELEGLIRKLNAANTDQIKETYLQLIQQDEPEKLVLTELIRKSHTALVYDLEQADGQYMYLSTLVKVSRK